MSQEHKFEAKYSKAIEAHGYITIPTLLLMNLDELDIASSELLTYMAIETYRWDNRRPFPSIKSISTRSKQSKSTVRANLRKLEKKKLVKRQYRNGQTNEYDFTPLIKELDKYAVSCKPSSGRLPPPVSDSYKGEYQNPDTKEDTYNNTHKENPFKQNGLKPISEVLKNKYRFNRE